MKNILSLIILFGLLTLSACSKQIIKPDNSYKGGALHQQPSIGIFPNENIYSLSSISDPLLENKLDSVMKRIVSDQDINGVSISMLIPNKGIWQMDSGYTSIPNNTLVDNTSVFYWASVAKLITSTLIHQLIAEDKLSLTDKLSNWYPQFEHAEQITIAQLLNHTNGIYSFNSDSTFNFSNLFYTPSELLDVSLAKSNHFNPGEYWSYNNTGYVLLALIAENVESNSYTQIVAERISQPQNLSSLRVLDQMEQPSNLALAHQQGIVVESHYSMPLGAGNIVASSKDMALFLQAFLTGKYLAITTVHDMLEDLYPMFDNGQYYGSGIMLYDFNEINDVQRQWIGHSGGTENYKAMLIFDLEKKVICATAVSQNKPAEAITYILMDLIE